MKKLILVLCLCALGCNEDPGPDLRTNDAPVLDVYTGIADEAGEFVVAVGEDAPLIQVYCTDLSGTRRSVSFTYRDAAITSRCESRALFVVSVVH